MVKLYFVFGVITLLTYLIIGVGRAMIEGLKNMEGDFWNKFIDVNTQIGSLLMCVLLWPFYSVYILQNVVNAVRNSREE